MNKKQLIVGWIMGLSICAIFLFPPHYYCGIFGGSGKCGEIDFAQTVCYIIPILILGILLILSLRDDVFLLKVKEFLKKKGLWKGLIIFIAVIGLVTIGVVLRRIFEPV